MSEWIWNNTAIFLSAMSLDIHKSMEKSANGGNVITLLEAKEHIQVAYPQFLHCHGIGGAP